MASEHVESLLCPCGPTSTPDGLHHRDPAPAVTRDDAAACVDVARALAAGLDLEWDTYTAAEQAVTVALVSQVFHAIDTAGYDIRPKTPAATCTADCGHVGCQGGCGIEHPAVAALPIHNDADALTAHVLGDRRGELLRPPGGERP